MLLWLLLFLLRLLCCRLLLLLLCRPLHWFHRLFRLLCSATPSEEAWRRATVAYPHLYRAFAFGCQVSMPQAVEAFRLLFLQQPDPAYGPPDDHGPRLGHLDDRILRSRDERGPVSSVITPPLYRYCCQVLGATPKVASPPCTPSSSAQLGTPWRRTEIRRLG